MIIRARLETKSLPEAFEVMNDAIDYLGGDEYGQILKNTGMTMGESIALGMSEALNTGMKDIREGFDPSLTGGKPIEIKSTKEVKRQLRLQLPLSSAYKQCL